MRKALEIGGILAAVVLVGFGIAAIVIGANGRSTVKSNVAEQKIVGTPDMTPSAIKQEVASAGINPSTIKLPTCSVAGKEVNDGNTARCFAEYMKVHALIATGGQLYSQMPRYATAHGPGTNDPAAALKDANGKPVENPARNVWVQETALSTALNASYMAEQTSIFGIVVGVALLLSGFGFAILAVGGALRNPDSAMRSVREKAHPAHETTAHPAGT
jgi:hypothetical protein